MTTGNYLSAVRGQYEELPYPPRDPQDERRRLLGSWHDALPLINHYCFAGTRDFRGGFRALVAGGGTGDALIFLAEQLHDLGGEAVYLDLSTSSMMIAQARAAARGLKNIRWVNGSLLDLPELGLGIFDYINCSGVLHHLADPDAGLRALTAALKPDGAMLIMVYGRYGRTAIYPLQDVLRQINLGASVPAEKIDAARRLLKDLPASNWFHHSREWFAGDLASDAGIFDLLLHSQDCAYTVAELYRWIEASGLRVASLMSPCRAAYLPETHVSDPLLREKLSALAAQDREAAAELIAGNLLRHFAYCSPGEVRIARLDQLDNIPFTYPHADDSIFDALYAGAGAPVSLATAHGLRIHLVPGRFSLDIFQYLDGTRSLREIFGLVREDHAGKGENLADAELLQDFAPVYEQLNAVDLMLLRHHSVPAFPGLAELQQRIVRRNPIA